MNRQILLSFILIFCQQNEILSFTNTIYFNDTIHELQRNTADCVYNVAKQYFGKNTITCLAWSGKFLKPIQGAAKLTTNLIIERFIQSLDYTVMVKEAQTSKYIVNLKLRRYICLLDGFK